MPAHENNSRDAPGEVPNTREVGRSPQDRPPRAEGPDQPEIPEEVAEQQLIGLDPDEVLKRQDGGSDLAQR